MASVLVAGAIGISYAGFTRAPGLHAPPWIAYVLALIFLVTAARVFEMTSGHAGTGDWFALVFFGAGAVVEWWIAFGADPRWCSSSPRLSRTGLSPNKPYCRLLGKGRFRRLQKRRW